MFNEYFESPIGFVEITANNLGLTGVYFRSMSNTSNGNRLTHKALEQLQEYFLGQRKHFDLPIATEGTLFQKQVWQQLQTIPYAETVSYQDIACGIGNLKAVRAVGAANGKNPISIIVPCHRVIGKNGTLTGYAGGMERKQWLLHHEQKHSLSKVFSA